MAKSKRRVVKKSETVRERAERSAQDAPVKKRRLRSAASTAKKPLSSAAKLGKREYHPVKLPDNKAGRFLGKSRSLIPTFLREAWAELKLVTWPNRRETIKLTVAVIIFAFIFGGLIAVVDWGIDKLFKQFLLS